MEGVETVNRKAKHKPSLSISRVEWFARGIFQVDKFPPMTKCRQSPYYDHPPDYEVCFLVCLPYSFGKASDLTKLSGPDADISSLAQELIFLVTSRLFSIEEFDKVGYSGSEGKCNFQAEDHSEECMGRVHDRRDRLCIDL